MILRYACCKHMVDHLFCIHVLRPAVTVPYHHNSRNAQFIYRNKQASNYASKGMRKLMFSNEDIAPVVIDTEALRQTYLELHRQGVNLNQLMTYLNTYKANADTRGITETLSKVYASLDKMDEVIDSVKKKTETL